MPDLGILRGLITLVTLATFLGICWWAYRPGNRARFEEDGRLAFADEELEPARDLQPPSAAVDENESDRTTLNKVEEGQA